MGNETRERTKVLLVDDNSFARIVGQRVLRAAGIHEIRQARSGSEALHLLGQLDAAIDVVFCDLMMPDIDGIQLLRSAANLATRPAFVFLSGANPGLLSIAEDTARARGLRVLGIIQKPLTVDAVRHVLAHLDDTPRAAQGGPGSVPVTPEDIENALAADQFILHYQPKISLADRSLVGFESLVRWRHPEKGLIPPTNFIGVAEQSGQIGALTDWVTESALKQCAAWALAGLRTTLSINMSAYMLVDLDLPDRLARKAELCRIDPR
jgi:CheY-like chemotaxis protein